MEYKILKALTVLGVPGVALGVFYLLLKEFNFEFEAIPPILSAAIAIIFLLVVGGVTLYGLHRWAPSDTGTGAITRDYDAIVRKLAEWTRIIHTVKREWRRAMDKDRPWPGEHHEVVERENTLYSEILGSLDSSRPSERKLVADIKAFRESDDLTTWASRRDSLLETVHPALSRITKHGSAKPAR